MIEVYQGRGTKGKKDTPKRPPKGSHRKKNTEYCEKIHKRGRSDGVHKTFFFSPQNKDIRALLLQKKDKDSQTWDGGGGPPF